MYRRNKKELIQIKLALQIINLTQFTHHIIIKGGDNLNINSYVLVPMINGSKAILSLGYYKYLKINGFDSFDLYL